MLSPIDLNPIRKSLLFGDYLRQLQADWQAEQTKRHAFWKDIDETQKAEFINGEGIYESPVYGRHWMASSNILTELLPFVKQHHLGKVGVEKVMVRCTRNDYEPDICFWSSEKAEGFKPKQSAFPPPDFVVEILSASTEQKDRGIKFEDYALHGIAEYWIVDTDEKTVEQYFWSKEGYQLHLKVKEGVLVSRAVSGFEIRVAAIFEGAE